MSKEKFPVTPATRVLHAHDVAFSGHLYSYQERGGTAHSARCLGVHEHAIIKTLIMENDRRQPLIVLMHGDRQVSTKELARALGAKSITPCDPAVAKGKRIALPNSEILIHQPLIGGNGLTGQATDIEIHARETMRLKEMLNTIMAEHTGQTVERIVELTERDNFMGAEEAVALGLIDRVLTSREDLQAEKK